MKKDVVENVWMMTMLKDESIVHLLTINDDVEDLRNVLVRWTGNFDAENYHGVELKPDLRNK